MATVFIQVRKRKNRNSYVVYYKDPATLRLRYYKTFRRQKDANDAANEMRTLIDTGKAASLQKCRVKPRLLTFSEVAQLQNVTWHERLEGGDISQKTFLEYTHIVGKLNKVFGNHRLYEISKEKITAYQSHLASESSNVNANRVLFIIKQVFKRGIAENAVLDDPSIGIQYLSERMHERNRFLLPAEIERLVEASRRTRARFYLPALIFLGAEHGASKQEALSLRWCNIDFEYEGRGMIRFFRTKNSRERTEYLMPRTRQALLDWRKHQNWMRKRKRVSSVKSDLVFCRLDGTPIKRFDSAWRLARRGAGLQDFHFHDLRHTFCSNLLLSGSDLKDVKEMIGHSDISMTDRYSHLTLTHKLQQQSKLAEHYSRAE
jgi:integrase